MISGTRLLALLCNHLALNLIYSPYHSEDYCPWNFKVITVLVHISKANKFECQIGSHLRSDSEILNPKARDDGFLSSHLEGAQLGKDNRMKSVY